MTSRHLIDLNQFTVSEWNQLIDLAGEIRRHPYRYGEACRGKILATLFYEPSTRTQMSFQTAMLKLGGRIIGFDNPGNSSVSKGESVKDTVLVVSGYADIIAMRHPKAGSAKAASMFSRVPLINAGDGGHLHPTQTLTDLVTLKEEKGTLEGLCIGCCGDLKNGRTVHSLIRAMSRFSGNSFVLVSTKELKIPPYIREVLEERQVPYTECHSLEEAIPMLDVLYMTRIQRERFPSPEEYEKQSGVFILDMKKLKGAKKDLKILHPLPRVDEIDVAVDDDPRAVYFAQTEYGMYARMALIMSMLEGSEKMLGKRPEATHDVLCANPGCITRTEGYLPRIFREKGDMLICGYCEEQTRK